MNDKESLFEGAEKRKAARGGEGFDPSRAKNDDLLDKAKTVQQSNLDKLKSGLGIVESTKEQAKYTAAQLEQDREKLKRIDSGLDEVQGELCVLLATRQRAVLSRCAPPSPHPPLLLLPQRALARPHHAHRQAPRDGQDYHRLCLFTRYGHRGRHRVRDAQPRAEDVQRPVRHHGCDQLRRVGRDVSGVRLSWDVLWFSVSVARRRSSGQTITRVSS